jgi:hypothetical protein
MEEATIFAKLLRNAAVSVAPDNNSERMGDELPQGARVNIVEVVVRTDQKRIRGRLDKGGWISLQGLGNEKDKVWIHV